MDSKNYVRWLETMLIPNLPPNSFLVLDNAWYHNIQTDKLPTSISKSDEMKAWLLERNIPFCDGMLKAQLYDLIKLNKPKQKYYVIDQILAIISIYNEFRNNWENKLYIEVCSQ
jgi:hypothetical protein